MKNIQFFIDDLTHSVADFGQSGLVWPWVHIAVTTMHCMCVVMGTHGEVVAQANGHALMPSVHGHEINIYVNKEIALGCAPV